MQLLFKRAEDHVELAPVGFLGLPVSDHSLHETAWYAVTSIEKRRPTTIIPLNPHVWCTGYRVSEVGEIMRRSIVTVDGIGILLASRTFGTPLLHRFTGSDLMETIVAMLAHERKSIFLLGGRAGVAAECAGVLSLRYPGLRIAGTLEPPDTNDARTLPEDQIVHEVNRSGADALFVALGAPKQEIFLHRNRDRIEVPFAMSVGASFDLITRRKQRAPEWMRRWGLEWLFRILQEPVRLGPRYVTVIPWFLWSAVIKRRPLL